MLKRTALGLALTALCVAGLAPQAPALEIYEPDGRFNEAPNALLASLPDNPDVQTTAKVAARGAELVATNPQFANAVVSMGPNGTVRAEVYLRLQRVMTIVGDDGTRANAVASALNSAYEQGALRADQLMPGRRNRTYTIMAGRTPIVSIDESLAKAQGRNPGSLTLRWLDNLRTALGGTRFVQTASRGVFAGSRVGHASWYGPGFHGHRAASGERFDQNMMTAAHKTLPFGTVLLVTNLNNRRSCLVRVNDRGPYIPGRMLDLSAAAARSIGVGGVATVRIDILRP